jgi:hypothetical protein
MQQEEKEKINKLLNTLLTTDGRGVETKRQALIEMLGSGVNNAEECADLIRSWKFKYRSEE